MTDLIIAGIKNGDSISKLAWMILGGEKSMPAEPKSTLDFVNAGNSGIPKLAVLNLAAVLNISLKDLATLFNVSNKILSRRRKPAFLLTSTKNSEHGRYCRAIG